MSEDGTFGERLAARVARRESQLVLGIDPDLRALWPHDEPPAAAAGGVEARAAVAVRRHCLALLDAAAPSCVAAKLQMARFEVLGAPGWEAMRLVAQAASEHDLLVILDGKRGDIDVSAEAYAAALFGGAQTPFGELPGLGADLATVNPLMGRDALEPFVRAARAGGGGVLVLVRTSNPGARDVEDLPVADGGGPVWERLAALVDELGADPGAGAGADAGTARSPGGADAATALADVGAVMGATEPRHLARARELMPRAPFLLPGVGAQGGRVEALGAAFAPGRAGGLISASRSISDAHVQSAQSPAQAARRAAERLREQAWALAEDLSGA